MKTRLSVNINKFALIRNSRESNLPDLSKIAVDCEAFGAEGITVHPRPDQRHIRYSDIPTLSALVKSEFNIEGYPSDSFIELVLAAKPHQVTLVPDPPEVLTSNTGWDTITNLNLLKEVIQRFKEAGIRVSLFLDPDPRFIEGAAKTGTDRIELYTGNYALEYTLSREKAITPHIHASELALNLGLGLNAGHDLNLQNLAFYRESVVGLLEVSIGHALVCDALYFGLENTIQMYLHKLNS
ncbi:MAG: pyridoxine 5'-phosphate synthase [Bacteroidota bacterium]|nr:pyridoxine 5'-phosphate synthase [Bacteroidota bacterium]